MEEADNVKLISFEAIVRSLNAAGVRYLIAGGLAVNAHGYLRFTKDADLVIQLIPDNIAKAFTALGTLGYKPSVPVTPEQFADDATREGWIRDKGMQVLQFWSDAHPETPIDIFVSEPFPFDEEFAHALLKPLYGSIDVRFVSIPTLIRMKEAVGREQDRIDIEHLRLCCWKTMPTNKPPEDRIDWNLTTWEGSRREALRRWSALPLERIIAALEEMQELSETLASPSMDNTQASGNSHAVHEPPAEYSGATGATDATAALPTYTDADLAGMDEATLIAHLRQHEDRAPRTLIDACAARGDAMVDALTRLLDTPAFWTDENEAGDWWLRLHSAMILGLIPTDAAGRLLVALMRKLDAARDNNTQDWLAGNWPALFANKPATLSQPLRTLVGDRSLGGYIRVNAMDPYLAFALHAGGTAFETALDWAAELAGDEQEERYVRLNLGNTLIDFPRDRHRALLDALAAQQLGLGRHFDARDIEHAYERDEDRPDWERFDDPWRFYEPEAIAARQRRWTEESREHVERSDYLDDPTLWTETYVRAGPKIGRNDPCPCGSGKKYKKCCLGKER